MDHDNFISLLNTKKGASPITITALTEPNWKPLKETEGFNPFKGSVKKRCRINGMIGWAYEAAVNRQRIRENQEPDFDALPRKWGTRLHGTPWVTHITKDGIAKTYLELKCENVYEVEYVDGNGNPVPFDVLHYIKESKNNPRQELEREIILRDYDVTNIVAFSWNGITDTLEQKRIAA